MTPARLRHLPADPVTCGVAHVDWPLAFGRTTAGLCVACERPAPDHSRECPCRSALGTRPVELRFVALQALAVPGSVAPLVARAAAPRPGRMILGSRARERADARRAQTVAPAPSVDPTAEWSRPTARGDCLQGEHAQRPCPFVGCKHHLYLEVDARTGSIKLNFPDREVWELPETCALDVADRGDHTLEEVARTIARTRELARQVEAKALARARATARLRGWSLDALATTESARASGPYRDAEAEDTDSEERAA